MASHKLLKRVDGAHDDGIWSVCWDRQAGGSFATGSVDDTAKVWNSSSVEAQFVLEGHQLGVHSVVFDPQGKFLATTALDSFIKLWDLQAGGALLKTIDAGPGECWKIDVHPAGSHIASGTHSGNVNVWSTKTGDKDTTLNTESSKFVMSVAYAPNGQHLACSNSEGHIFVFDLTTGKRIHKLEAHSLACRSLAFSHDSKMLLSASDDMHVTIFDFEKGCEQVANVSGHSSWILCVDMSRDSRHFATGSSDTKVKLWDIRSPKVAAHTFEGHTDQVWGVCFDPNGSKLVSVGDDKAIQVCEVGI